MKKLMAVIMGVMILSGCSTFSWNCDTNGLGSVEQNTVYFDFDSSVLRADTIATLDNQANELVKSDDQVVVEGHADERGTREYNIALGERRASAVKTYLVSKGVAESRIETVSYGKERPAVIGNTEEAYAKNRRAVTVAE